MRRAGGGWRAISLTRVLGRWLPAIASSLPHAVQSRNRPGVPRSRAVWLRLQESTRAQKAITGDGYVHALCMRATSVLPVVAS